LLLVWLGPCGMRPISRPRSPFPLSRAGPWVPYRRGVLWYVRESVRMYVVSLALQVSPVTRLLGPPPAIVCDDERHPSFHPPSTTPLVLGARAEAWARTGARVSEPPCRSAKKAAIQKHAERQETKQVRQQARRSPDGYLMPASRTGKAFWHHSPAVKLASQSAAKALPDMLPD